MFARAVNDGVAAVAFNVLLFVAPKPPNKTTSSGLLGFTAKPSKLVAEILVADVPVGAFASVDPEYPALYAKFGSDV